MSRRQFLRRPLGFVSAASAAGCCLAAASLSPFPAGPDPIFEKPTPLTMAELASRGTDGVSAVEVRDYAPGHYAGAMSPSPPHADINPGRAVVVSWKGSPLRFVFSHEASYCPLLELPSGAAMCDQFFEGNLGDAELFNEEGRKERNSFVDVVQAGPDRAWVRWTYFCVNMKDDSKPRLRGTEDYFAYPNGLILRRLTYQSLMPGEVAGYSTQPVELFGVMPAGSVVRDLFLRDPRHGDSQVLSAIDVYSDRHYDIFWGDKGEVRRVGDDLTLVDIWKSPGYALVIPFREKLLFAVLGRASGFPTEKNRLVDHSTPGAQGGAGWGAGLWDHWPIGWLNSQTSYWKPGSPYSYSFGSIGQFLLQDDRQLVSFWRDYSESCNDMVLNRWTERHVFYVLLGSADDWGTIRRIGKAWLDQGAGCARPESIANLK